MRDPLTNVVRTQLGADAVKRAGLSAFPRDRVTYLTLLSGVDLLPFLDLRGILGRGGGGDRQREHDREQRTHQTSSFPRLKPSRSMQATGFSRRSNHHRYRRPNTNEFAVYGR